MKRNRPRRFAEGGSDRYKDRYDRKVADIESDYTKALKAGKNADIAKAKYNQRMADAKDDLAKWTKADRSETSAAEKAAEAALSAARQSGGASMREAPAIQSLGTKLDVAPMGRMPKVALPDVGRPRTATPSPERVKAAIAVATGKNRPSEPISPRPEFGESPFPGLRTRSFRDFSSNTPTDFRRFGPGVSAQRGFEDLTPRERDAMIARMMRGATMKKGGVAKKKPAKASAPTKRYAKGGSVDGCAIRGRTRAPMKKGKR